MNFTDVVFLQIPEKDIYYCKHNIFCSSIQMDTEDMSCFQTKASENKKYLTVKRKFRCIVVSLLEIIFNAVLSCGGFVEQEGPTYLIQKLCIFSMNTNFYDPSSFTQNHFFNTHNI